MTQYIIITTNGKEQTVNRNEFKETYARKRHYLYSEGNVRVLMPDLEEYRSIYHAHMRFLWNEQKRIERMTRCIDEYGNICKGNCTVCDKNSERPNHMPLSIDALYEDGGYEIADTSFTDILVADKLLIEMLNESLGEEMWSLAKEVLINGKSLRSYVNQNGNSYSTSNSTALYQKYYRQIPNLKTKILEIIKNWL